MKFLLRKLAIMFFNLTSQNFLSGDPMIRFPIILYMGFAPLLFAQQIELRPEEELPHRAILLAYNEEADLHFARREYAIALENYQRVISFLEDNELSEPAALLEAMCGQMFCYDMLDQEPFAKAAFEELAYEVATLNEKIEEVD